MAAFMTVFQKEIEDHFNSWRFIFAFLIVFIPSIFFVWRAAGIMKGVITGFSQFAFMPLFTTSIFETPIGLLPTSFLELIAILLPLVGIALGMDAINSERNNGTLSKLISQPIYRDNVINAKFMAGFATISILMVSVVLLIVGMGIYIIGIPPTAEEAWRILFFLVISIIYGAFWLGLSILFSILFRSVAASALVSIGVWLFFAFLFPLIQQLIAGAMTSDTQASAIRNVQTLITISRISPIQLFNESMVMILAPGARTITQLLQLMTGNAGNFALNTPLSLGQSLLSVWPQIIITIVLTAICFAISYIRFMREEIRST